MHKFLKEILWEILWEVFWEILWEMAHWVIRVFYVGSMASLIIKFALTGTLSYSAYLLSSILLFFIVAKVGKWVHAKHPSKYATIAPDYTLIGHGALTWCTLQLRYAPY